MEKNENGYSEYFSGNRSSTRRSPSGAGCAGRDDYRNENSGSEMGNMENMSCPVNSRQLAMVYSPYQCWRMLYTPDNALKHGTLFEELYKPLEECGNGRS